MALVLASESPRRKELLALLTNNFETDQAGVDESVFHASLPEELAVRLAKAKAEAVYKKRPNDIVIGCDTVVDLKGVALGKPADQQAALEMLRNMAGRRHYVHTGVCVVSPAQNGEPQVVSFVNTTSVDFSPIPDEDIQKYIQTNEAYDKAGGYGIQGWASRYITRIEGCYYNVMGLPVAALYQVLNDVNAL